MTRTLALWNTNSKMNVTPSCITASREVENQQWMVEDHESFPSRSALDQPSSEKSFTINTNEISSPVSIHDIQIAPSIPYQVFNVSSVSSNARFWVVVGLPKDPGTDLEVKIIRP
jgi:hypothetical protein